MELHNLGKDQLEKGRKEIEQSFALVRAGVSKKERLLRLNRSIQKRYNMAAQTQKEHCNPAGCCAE
jgi:hypothetical protein